MRIRYVALFWRVFVPNAIVLGVACVALMLQPPNGRVPVLAAGLVVMLAVDWVLLRRAVTPLVRLTDVMRRVDPLEPGARVNPTGPPSEVTVLGRAFNEMLDRLEHERVDSGRRALSEIEAERRRISAELHDEIGQSLTAIALHLDRLGVDAPPSRGEIELLRDAVLATVEDVRALARELRPEALDSLGLVPALTNLTERLTRHTGIDFVRRLEDGLPPLTSDAELVVYRVAQESLTNAVRHATPTSVTIDLHRTDGGVLLCVCDDGVGLNGSSSRGSGIRAMRERALAVGATLDIGRAASGGTEVRLAVPVADRP